MQNRIEPPVLVSRLMAFVLAMAVVVLVTMGYTIYKMFPLNRPQVFFLTSTLRADQEVHLVEMLPNSANFDEFKKAFVREYIRHRNEIITDLNTMVDKWNNENSLTRTMSTPQVYSEMANTKLFTTITSGMPDFNLMCFVSFPYGEPIYMASEDRYRVKFRYSCADNTGRAWSKDYTIGIRLETQGETAIRWTDRITNPLGLRVSEYKVIEGDGDPLDAGFQESVE